MISQCKKNNKLKTIKTSLAEFKSNRVSLKKKLRDKTPEVKFAIPLNKL